jgi:hypothetical protein
LNERVSGTRDVLDGAVERSLIRRWRHGVPAYFADELFCSRPISASVAGGSKLNSVRMLRHIVSVPFGPCAPAFG